MAALNIVVEAEQIPPPIAPFGFVRPLSMIPPIRNPRANVTGPTAPQKSNTWPGPTTVPLMSLAGIRMLFPNPFFSLVTNRVVHAPTRLTWWVLAEASAALSSGGRTLRTIGAAAAT